MQVFLNNCRASVDLVTFQAPVERMLESRNLTVVDGDLGRFVAEDDAALVGIDFAERKELRVGQSFPFGGIDVKVAGIFTSWRARRRADPHPPRFPALLDAHAEGRLGHPVRGEG